MSQTIHFLVVFVKQGFGKIKKFKLQGFGKVFKFSKNYLKKSKFFCEQSAQETL